MQLLLLQVLKKATEAVTAAAVAAEQTVNKHHQCL
jgi:hypothetical protein